MPRRRVDTYKYRRNRDIILAGRPACAICHKEMLFEGDIERDRWWLHPLAATVDHIVPLIENGSDDLSNLRPAHRRCNSALGNRQRRKRTSRRLRDFGRPNPGIYDG